MLCRSCVSFSSVNWGVCTRIRINWRLSKYFMLSTSLCLKRWISDRINSMIHACIWPEEKVELYKTIFGLSANYSICIRGQKQSPITISNSLTIEAMVFLNFGWISHNLLTDLPFLRPTKHFNANNGIFSIFAYYKPTLIKCTWAYGRTSCQRISKK